MNVLQYRVSNCGWKTGPLHIPSSRNAAGHPTAFFHPVTLLQKMLSRFQMKNPNAKVDAPLLNSQAMVLRDDAGMRSLWSEILKT